jgi:glutamyl/glutaminyl-tRNA synthetase
MRHEVLSLQDMINQFNIDKVSKSGAKFDIEKLEYFNSMHIREKFDYSPNNMEEMAEAVAKWRDMLEDEMPRELIK